MRKILRYTKLLIASTLLTASFGLTTEAVRAGYSDNYYQTGQEANSQRSRQYEIRGDNASKQANRSFWRKDYQQAAIEYNRAANAYASCYEISRDAEAYQKMNHAANMANQAQQYLGSR